MVRFCWRPHLEQVPSMTEKLTEYKRRPYFSEIDRTAFLNVVRHLGKGDLVNSFRLFYWWFHNEAWRFSPYQIYERFVSAAFDQKHGTNTTTRVNISDMRISGPNAEYAVYYQASPVVSTRRVLRDLVIRYDEFAFIDFGSGKGRTLLVASEFPFDSVTGVEFGAELHQFATENIKIFGKRAARHVRSLHADATTIELPAENLVLYFFNPFGEAVLRQVIANITESLRRYPRRAIIVYRYLPDNSLIGEHCGFRLVRDWQRYRIYEWIGDTFST